MSIPGVRRIDHIAIAVRSIEAALPFYAQTLGIVPSAVQTIPSEGVRIAFLPLGGPAGTKIELIEPLDPANSIGRFIERRGPGQHHVCLEVADIDAALAALQAAGVPVLDAQPRITAEGRGVFIHPSGTGGVLLELVESEGGPR